MRVGVLALQGDVREHLGILESLGANGVSVRTQKDLTGLDGLILPGGESTTISKLIDIFQLRDPIIEFASSGKGLFGTCAGMIMLATEVLDAASNQKSLGLIDISVRRNAFGSQLDSFETDISFDGRASRVAFIRGPVVERVGADVEVLATLDSGKIVAVRNQRVLATSFHPEITGERSIHKYFLEML